VRALKSGGGRSHRAGTLKLHFAGRLARATSSEMGQGESDPILMVVGGGPA